MTTGPTDGTVTTAADGPGGMPLALRLNEGLGLAVPSLRRTSMFMKILKPLVLRGPVTWCASWHNKVMRCQMEEWFYLRPMTLRDLLPWTPTRPALVEANDVSLATQQLLSSCCSTNSPDQAQQQEPLGWLPVARGSDCQEECKS